MQFFANSMLLATSQPSYALSLESSRLASLRQRFMVLPATVLVPTLGSPVLPPCCLAGASAKSQGSASLSASALPPWSAKIARAAFTLCTPASCSLKSMWSDSPCALSSAISPRSCSDVSAFLAASTTCAPSAAILSSRSATAFS